jgi:type IV pilus assembly protein PilM
MLKFPRTVLCLDWDRRALRMVVARVGGGSVKLQDAHSHRVPPEVDSEDPKAMGEFISQSMRRHGWRNPRVLVDVPRDKAVINRLTLPPTPATELAGAVRFQALKELPFTAEEAAIDFGILNRDAAGQVTEVLLGAVRNETLERIRQTCAAAGLSALRIGLRPYANMVSVRQLPSLADKRVLLVDVGPTTTEIDVFRGNALAFSRSAAVTVPPHSAAYVSDESRIRSRDEVMAPPASDEAAGGAVADLLVEITRTLQAYRATDNDSTIDQIVIAGGTGIETELLTAVAGRYGLPAMLFDPTGPLGASRSEAVKLRAFSAALGLAWGASREGLLELDFLNPKRPRPANEPLIQRLRVYGAAAAVVVIALGAFAVTRAVALTRQRNALDRQISELRKKVEAKRTVEVITEEVKDWEKSSAAVRWLDHLLALTESAVEPGRKLMVRDASFDEATATMVLKVACSNWEIAHEFVQRINAQQVDGRQIYRAAPGTWQEVATGDADFRGRVDVRVELLSLKEFNAGAKKREDERKQKIKVR